MEYRINELKKDLITKRQIDNNMSMDEACKEIGISKATLSRLEKGRLPDMETFAKVVGWLGKPVNNYFTQVGRRQDGFNPNFNVYDIQP